MRKVGLYLGFPPEGGGAFQYAQSMLDAVVTLPKDEYKIVVAYAHPSWASILVRYYAAIAPLAVHESQIEPAIRFALRQGFSLHLWRWLAPKIHGLTRQLLRQNCDVWIFPAQDVLTYALPAATIGVIHDLMHRHQRDFPEVSGWGLFQRRERHYRRLCAQACGVLVDSKTGKSHVIDAYTVIPERVHILPYIAPRYITQNPDPVDFDSRYILPSRFIFYPAQFWQHKNHVRLVEALSRAIEFVPDLHLVLVGSKKNAYTRVLKTIDKLKLQNQVHVFGYIPDRDMSVFYRRARALVMPTFFGPTNIPPLEAMAMGCPMAVSNIYAMAEQVGEAALLFDPASVTDIANSIVRLATDDALCVRLSAAGKRRATQWGQPEFNARLLEIVRRTIAPK